MHLLCLLALLGCGPSGRLYLAGRDPGTLTRVDTATGAVATRTGLRQLGGGDPPYFVRFTGGRLVTLRAWPRDVVRARDAREQRDLPRRAGDHGGTGERPSHDAGRVTGAVDDGLVLQRKRLEVWDPRTRRMVRRYARCEPFLASTRHSGAGRT